MEASEQAQPMSSYREQIELLNNLTDKQIQQDHTLAELKAHNSELLEILASITENQLGQPDGLAHVKIENINMPFWAMVGFLLKLTFASIPAGIVIFILSLIVMAALAAVGLIPLLLGLGQINF
jgi:hypothetical protein